MKSSDSQSIEISVIVPVYQTDPKLIKETLQSVVNQTLDKENYEIIVVDDGSTSVETFDFLVQLAQSETLNGISLTVLRHQTNKWLAEVRNTGAEHARGEYLCFLDSDDLIDPDYLKKGILALKSHPNAAWTYPVVREFDYFHSRIPPPDFNAWHFFLRNFIVNASILRKACWERVKGQRTVVLTGDVKFYEDWDFWVRAMQRGYYAVPLGDSAFHYRRRPKSMITRGPILHYLSAYVVWRKNLFRFPFLYFSQRNYTKDLFPEKRLRKLPARLLSSLITRHLPYKLKLFPVSLFLESIFRPNTFIEKCLSGDYLPTAGEYLCGFSEKPRLSFSKPDTGASKNTIFFAHYWWCAGGAEQVLLNWLEAAKSLTDYKVIDIVHESVAKDDYFKEQFSRFSDEQFTIDKLGVTAKPRLMLCWELFLKERPKIIFVMHNSFYYLLAPKIKEHFPETKIIDLLHNEDLSGKGSWFAASDDYKKYIDQRIVISDFWKDVLVNKYGESKEKITVIKNAISLDKFDPDTIDKREARRSLNIPESAFVVGFIGRLDLQKNPEVILELAHYSREDARLIFVVVGSGPLEEELRAKLEALPNVRYFPFTDTPQTFYRAVDMLVCPSKFEGYPLTGIEAAAMKVPLIATDIPGFQEQVKKGQFGFLYKPVSKEADAKTIYNIIDKYISDPSLDLEQGRAFVEQYHDITKQRLAYKETLQKLLG